jgi:L-iditol 2-dehydrogenase
VMPFVTPGVVKIPARNTFAEGAMLEPVNTVLKAVNRLALLRGDTVLVSGQGPIGLMFTRLLVLAGMNVLASDLFPGRLRVAWEFGAKWVFRPEIQNPKPKLERTDLRIISPQSTGRYRESLAALVDRVTKGRGLDAAVMAVASPAAMREAQALVRGGGQLLLFSSTRRGDEATLDLASICVDEKDLIGSYSADFLLQGEVARLVFSRKLDTRRLITHEFPLARTAEAVELAAHPTFESLKVVVNQQL